MSDLLSATISNFRDEETDSDDKKSISLDGKTNCGVQITQENKENQDNLDYYE